MSEIDKNNNGQSGKNQETPRKKNLIVRVFKAVKNKALDLQEKHPTVCKVAKTVTGVGALIGVYKFGFNKGAKSVVPTTVYIQSGCDEEPETQEEEETTEEEMTEEPAIEETAEV